MARRHQRSDREDGPMSDQPNYLDDPDYLSSIEAECGDAAETEHGVDDEPVSFKNSRRPRRDDADWMAEVPFLRDQKRQVMSRRHNIYLCLKHDPAMADLVAYDDIDQAVMVMRALEVDEESKLETGFPKPLTDIYRSRIMRHLEKNPSLPRFGEQEIKAAMEDFAERIRFNSLSDYLNGLEWDGKMRMHTLFEHYFSATAAGPLIHTGANFYLSKVSIWFLTGLVRRALQPGCINQYVAIFSGPQGNWQVDRH
jgi:predicted P-loop ATPase